jgi:hypothetical protein
MSAEGSPTGAGRSTNLLTMEKMVALAAMPRPMETMTARTIPGDLDSRRNVYARSYRQPPMVFYTFSVKGATALVLRGARHENEIFG